MNSLKDEVAVATDAMQVLTELGVPPKGAALYIEMYKGMMLTTEHEQKERRRKDG